MGSERVRIEKLKGVENWGIWKFQVKIHIEVGEALGVVDGNHVKPTLAENADAGAKSEHQKEIKQQWYSFNRDVADDIAAHIAKIKDLAHRLSILGEPVPDGMVITKILMTLPPAWESTNEEWRTLTNFTVRLTMEEFRVKASDDQGNSAFWMKTKQKQVTKRSQDDQKKEKKAGKCYLCGKRGHWK
ncbi:uncharacterized protein [Venturia canescens]|uniref:uncharacterized protein isoform X1 n=1 Tax=Venturia canescens TaxID=32260 RepID=UPI001C9C7D02|nr:uncharacterized protein LOC122408128 isoform X1 [Venturia canescens]